MRKIGAVIVLILCHPGGLSFRKTILDLVRYLRLVWRLDINQYMVL
jgi:hypothetical protein